MTRTPVWLIRISIALLLSDAGYLADQLTHWDGFFKVAAPLAGFVAVYLLTFLPDRRKVSWLLSEHFSERMGLHRAFPAAPGGNQAFGESLVCAEEIRAGNLICQSDGREEPVRPGTDPVHEQQPDPGRPYMPVLAVAHGDGQVEIGIAGDADPRLEEPGTEYFRRRRPLSPSPGSGKNKKLATTVAAALEDLMRLLPDCQDPALREDTTVAQLANQGQHSDWSAMNAIRIAISARLVERERNWRYWLGAFNVPSLFKQAEPGGHAGCQLRLTDLGALWKTADPGSARPEGRPGGRAYGGNSVNIHVGDNYQSYGNTGAMGPNSVVTQPVMNSPQPGPAGADTKALAAQLSALCTTLQARAETEEHYLAAKHVELATEAIRQGDENAARAHASQLGKCALWAVNTATAIGVGVAAAWLSRYA